MTDTSLAASRRPAAIPSHGVSFPEAFRVWLRVAALSFGGPAGQIAVMHRIIVDEKKWVGENRFLHALSYCMLLPGPEAHQLAIYIGWLMHRWPGAIIAGGLFVLPGILSIMALSVIYAAYGSVPVITALFLGLKAAVLAIVLHAVQRVGSRALKSRPILVLAALAFIGIFFFNVPFPLIVIGAGIIGFVAARVGSTAFQVGGAHGSGHATTDEGLLGADLPELARPRVADIGFVARPLAAARHCHWLFPGRLGRLYPDRPVLFQNGRRHLWRRLCGARLYGAAGGRNLWLAQARRDAGWPWNGGDDAGAAHYGGPIRRVSRCLSRPRHIIADARWRSW